MSSLHPLGGGGGLKNPSLGAQVVFFVNIIINVFTFPFTAFLKALVMFAVKTKRQLRAQKSHTIIALLATTDFTVGILIQPATVAWLISSDLNQLQDWNMPIFFLKTLNGQSSWCLTSPCCYDKLGAVYCCETPFCVYILSLLPRLSCWLPLQWYRHFHWLFIFYGTIPYTSTCFSPSLTPLSVFVSSS